MDEIKHTRAVVSRRTTQSRRATLLAPHQSLVQSVTPPHPPSPILESTNADATPAHPPPHPSLNNIPLHCIYPTPPHRNPPSPIRESTDADATRRPHGDTCRSLTSAVWPLPVAMRHPVMADQNLTRPSSAPVMTTDSSLDHATQ